MSGPSECLNLRVSGQNQYLDQHMLGQSDIQTNTDLCQVKVVF